MTKTPQDQPITHNTYNHTYIIDQVGNLNARDVINQGDQVGIQTQAGRDDDNQEHNLSQGADGKKFNSATKPLNVYICHATENECRVKEDDKYCRDLVKCLAGLEEANFIRIWHKGMLRAGAVASKEISIQLNVSQLFLPLISKDFTDCYRRNGGHIRHETSVAISAVRSRKISIVPIIIRPTSGWKNLPFGDFEALPRNGQSIGSNKSRDKSLCEVYDELEKKVLSIFNQV